MRGASKVIMAATLVMVVTLAIVLGLVLVLLAELYCTLLLRRQRMRANSSNAATAPTTAAVIPTSAHPPQAQNRSDAHQSYAPGVLEAPRSLFYPAISSKEKCSQLHHFLQLHTQQSNSSPRHVGLVKISPSPTSSPHQIREIQIQINAANEEEPVVYISNPIYENRVETPTPFETPDSSPSRLENGSGGSSAGDDEEIGKPQPCSPTPVTPPLTPMKKLPAEASSVSLRDARSLGTSGSDSVSNNGLSSSSSGSPCTSPSW